MPFETELASALEAAARAGQLLQDAYARFQAIPDAPASISTEADRLSQEQILNHVHRLFPADALCAEEESPSLAQIPRCGARLWVVDPIDGTRGFARKNGEFSVMIAFVDRGLVAVGVVLEPALGRLTYAVRGGGCWRRDGNDATPVPCRVSGARELTHAALVQSRSRPGAGPSRVVQALKPGRVVETYSAGIKLAQVARGDVDIYVNSYEAFHDWDICAGHILVEEAGGTVTGLGGGPLQYGLPDALQTQGLLGTNGLLHAAAVAALRSA